MNQEILMDAFDEKDILMHGNSSDAKHARPSSAIHLMSHVGYLCYARLARHFFEPTFY